MLAWIRSPRGSTATATVVAVILAMSWLAPWSKPLPFHMPFLSWGPGGDDTPAPVTASTAGESQPSASTSPSQPVVAATPPSSVAGRGEAPVQTAATDASAPESAPGIVPSFDIVRVEPTGEAVIAGRAEAGSTVSLLDGDKQLAQAVADANGQFALLPPRLDEGNHYLSLKTQKAGKSSVKSLQGVAVAVAKSGGSKPLVALLSPDAPTRVLSDGATAEPQAPAPGDDHPATLSAAVPVAIQSVEAGRGGKFMASGVAHPGNQCRVYLNGAYLADVTAGKDGRWSVAIEKGMKPGRYTVRADELSPAGGAVVHRAEVPFDYPASVADTGTGRQQLMKSALSRDAMANGRKISQGAGPDAGSITVASAEDIPTGSVGPNADTAIIANLGTATVTRGDSLWRISKKMLGHGIQYTEIYASNVRQIRDPALIYPGQVFVVPSKAAK